MKINHNGQVGYVSGEFVSGVSSNAGSSNNNTNNNNQEVKPASGNYTVNVSSLRVRTGPSTSHTTVGSVKRTSSTSCWRSSRLVQNQLRRTNCLCKQRLRNKRRF